MAKINWKIRIKNKTFWIAIIPATLLLIQAIANVFGYVLNLGELGNKLLEVVNTAFAVLVLLGVVTDPTSTGVSDSKLALTYKEPNND
jgi:phi LC3 family holin